MAAYEIGDGLLRKRAKFNKEQVLFTSREMGWRGFTVETRMHLGGTYPYTPSDDHLISVHLGPSICLERKGSEGHVYHEQIEYGTVVVVAAGQSSFWRHTAPSYFLNLKLSPSVLDQVAAQMETPTTAFTINTSHRSFRDPHLEQLSMLLRLEMEAGAPHGNLYAETLTNALCVRLLQRENKRMQVIHHPSMEASPNHIGVRRAAAFIQDNLSANLPIDTIARVAGMSTYHFARSFTQTYGVPPHRYVIQTRIERAQRLIIQDGEALSNVARRVGFSDQSHFTRHFKRLVGVTPRAFAQNASRKNVP